MSLTIEAPAGATFEQDEVKTERGTKSLGEAPILTWTTLAGLIAAFGEEKVLDVANGTSARVSYQAIARRGKIAGKSDDEIAQAQIAFRPGTRVGGKSTPESRAGRAARTAMEKSARPDLVAAFLEKLAKGEISDATLSAAAGL